jgi:hypothetical protein
MALVLRSLNRIGLDRFRAYLHDLRAGKPLPVPLRLLADAASTSELPVEIEIELRTFANRLELGRYLTELLAPLEPDVTDRDAGIWAWMALFYFEQVCPAEPSGVRFPGKDYRHVPEFAVRERHRHLLFGPYQVYRRHGERSALLLTGALDTESRVYHEIVSRRDLIANRGVIEAALALYFDAHRGRPKPGAQGSNHPGTVRRFVRVLQQLDVTYDIFGLSGAQLLEILPPEFDAWRSPQLAMSDGHASPGEAD